MRIVFISLVSAFIVSSCASITNDAYVPMAVSFSDGSSGECSITNKRMAITEKIPGNIMVRRSDDNLLFNCETDDGRKATTNTPSELGAKIVASAVFLDFGIVDAITDKHRNYPASFVIPVRAK